MSREGEEPSGERVSYWLVPAQPDKSRLQRMIFAFANRFDAPRFEPHVTIYSGPHAPQDDVVKKLAAATRRVPPIVLRATGIAHSEEFTKTLFLEFAPDEQLLKLSRKLKRISSKPDDYELKPHLSLVYTNLPLERKSALVRELMFLPSVRFNVVKAILSKGRTQTRQDVEAWRVIAEQKLGQR